MRIVPRGERSVKDRRGGIDGDIRNLQIQQDEDVMLFMREGGLWVYPQVKIK